MFQPSASTRISSAFMSLLKHTHGICGAHRVQIFFFFFPLLFSFSRNFHLTSRAIFFSAFFLLLLLLLLFLSPLYFLLFFLKARSHFCCQRTSRASDRTCNGKTNFPNRILSSYSVSIYTFLGSNQDTIHQSCT